MIEEFRTATDMKYLVKDTLPSSEKYNLNGPDIEYELEVGITRKATLKDFAKKVISSMYETVENKCKSGQTIPPLWKKLESIFICPDSISPLRIASDSDDAKHFINEVISALSGL